MPSTSLNRADVDVRLAPLADVDARIAARFRRTATARQPVHTCYVPAGRVDAGTLRNWGDEALAALDEHAPSAADLAGVIDVSERRATEVLPRVRAKLQRSPVEDLRIDFEDGYGAPGDEVEDADAERTAGVVAEWLRQGTAPDNFGLRVKSFDDPELRARSVRTLDVFLTELLARHGELPGGFLLTFPKVVDVRQVEAFVEVLELVERTLGLASGSLRFEIQVETTQSIVDTEGRLALPRFIGAGRDRISGLHFGTYDYTAGCGLTAAHQHLAHRACDFARHVMQVSAAGTGIFLSDGSTNVLPVGGAEQVRHGWRTHYGLVRRSLEHGFYQGWDLHPAQLVTRYAAVFAEFRDSAESEAARLAAYVSATGGAVLDEPATARALAASFVRALDNGATDAEEVARMTGVPEPELRELGRV
ncbi:HpcH/HpaI aldolase/citrate lyase family protein [Actinopolyspora mzabensis]|uniref:HpcH/HpaI aldolase/citrate lyase family protein n=1 Tax=Actinopolyspora mzabensis TaxID=995066 RepID=A0A1G8VGQ6_ACTMZ|nr:aldolase/citrate lyase family protein [Actinopolyspora mzabensis]SDJ64340.1 HpcH/HpaI aldolase/citrate lyase family protein [Actinopolyspora mzabensis]